MPRYGIDTATRIVFHDFLGDAGERNVVKIAASALVHRRQARFLAGERAVVILQRHHLGTFQHTQVPVDDARIVAADVLDIAAACGILVSGLGNILIVPGVAVGRVIVMAVHKARISHYGAKPLFETLSRGKIGCRFCHGSA